jgi:cytochrome c oxidase assembly protein subunit 20
MAGGPEGPEVPPGGRKVWLWTRATPAADAASDPAAASSPQTTPPTASKDSAQLDPRLDTTRTPPKDLPVLPGKLDPSAFQTNFPQQQAEPATVTAALKTIKPEDFLTVTSGACARDGFLGGITTGAVVGGVRFVMRGRSSSLSAPACGADGVPRSTGAQGGQLGVWRLPCRLRDVV